LDGELSLALMEAAQRFLTGQSQEGLDEMNAASLAAYEHHLAALAARFQVPLPGRQE